MDRSMADIEMFDQIVEGLVLECVRDSEHPECLLIHTWDGRRARTVPTLEHKGVSFIPRGLTGDLLQLICFPPPSQAFKSTADLVKSLRTFLSTYAHLGA